jgi:hypothetical protein
VDQLRAAHACARERFWSPHGLPERLTIDLDATLITSHSEEKARPATTRAATGPTRCTPTRLRPARRSGRCCGPGIADTAADHVAVLDLALEQIPAAHVEQIEILVRADRAGATHELVDYCRDGRLRFSFGSTSPRRSATRSSSTAVSGGVTPFAHRTRAPREC